MKAAVLNAFGSPLEIQTLPDPVLGTGEVIVDVVATGVTSYAAEVFSGARKYTLELPVVPGPGGIGRVRATGPDATRLAAGDWVYCDPTVRSRDDILNPDMMLQGWSSASAAALPLHRFHHDGSFAEQMRVPTENITPIGDIDAKDAGAWCALGRMLVPYGGLLAIDLRAGETLVINGATGGFGSAGVAVALAMGAGKVVATGRNARALEDMVRRFGPRVVPVPMTGVESDDRRRIIESAGGPIDCVLDLLPREATPAQVRAAITTVRYGGRVVLMGGVGRRAGSGHSISDQADPSDLALPYPWLMRNEIVLRGKWMYPREAPASMIRLIRSGHLDLAKFDRVEFPLDQANEAVAHAAENARPFQLTVIRPG
jgi:alcohol dehydrogenase